jgi:hypothetical protein
MENLQNKLSQDRDTNRLHVRVVVYVMMRVRFVIK